MNRSCGWLFGALLTLASVVSVADETTIGGQINGVPIGQQAAPAKSKPPGTDTERKSCLSQCMAADSQCGSEVRQARQECSRNAATNGRDPFDTRKYNGDFSYFCEYFNAPVSCGSDRYGCRARYSQRYSQCLGLMRENIASMRYDCFRSERDAQNLCRSELRDCKAACQ
jgi:hypothetical protein